MPYEEWEIVELYNNSKHQKREISILADLNLTTKRKIVEILEKHGCEVDYVKRGYTVSMRKCKCRTCGAEFMGYANSRFCEKCGGKTNAKRKEFDLFNEFRSELSDKLEELIETKKQVNSDIEIYRKELKELDEYLHEKA